MEQYLKKYPCNCYDAHPRCFCSPFKAGYQAVPPPIRLCGTDFQDPTNNVVKLKGMNWYEPRLVFLPAAASQAVTQIAPVLPVRLERPVIPGAPYLVCLLGAASHP